MRLSSLSLAVVLLLSCLALAQHQNTPSAPPPTPLPPQAAPSHAPSPAPTVTPSPGPSAPAAASVSHARPEPAPSSAVPAHMTEPSSASHPHEADRIVPENKITGEQKIESAPRVGDDLNVRESGDKDSPDKGKEAKAEPDLRRHLCGDKPCEKLEPKPVESPEQELRHHPCVKEPCSCPPGQKTNDGGCVATVAQNQCPAGQIWNGLNCVPNGDECIAITGRAAHLIIELRDLRARLEEACAQNSSGQQCMDLTRQHTFVLEQYRVQWLQASPVCRGRLPDPITL